MKHPDDAGGVSRRAFCQTGVQALAGIALPAAAATQPLRGSAPSSQDIVSALGGIADAEPVAGQSGIGVTGVAFLADPTLAALRQAVTAGASLILSPETPFYTRVAAPTLTGSVPMPGDRLVATLLDSPAYKAKQQFILENGLTLYRLNPRRNVDDASAEAIAAKLDWTRHGTAGNHSIYAPPGLTLARLVKLAHQRLGASGGLRFIGDPEMRLRSVLIVPGTAEAVSTTQALRHADALLTGDVREWEVVTYVHDSALADFPKGLVATGRILSEQPFIERCSLIVAQAFPDVPRHFIALADPFWRVQA